MDAARILKSRLRIAGKCRPVLVELRRGGGEVAQGIDMGAAHTHSLDRRIDLLMWNAQRQVSLVLGARRRRRALWPILHCPLV